MAENKTVVIKENNGTYKWRYEVSLFRDLSIFGLTCKVMLFTLIGVWLVFSLIFGIVDGNVKETFLNSTKIFGVVAGIMAVLCVLGYLLYAAIMGGKYKVNFTMDDEKLVHAQQAEQAEKAKGIGVATAVVGLLAKRPSTVGAGLAASRTEMTTYWSEVRKVIVHRGRNTIELRGGGQNNIYAPAEDFDFVRDYVRAHVGEGVQWTE
jgi:hypothetical protein